MKSSLAALRLPVFTLFLSMLLAGCGGTGNTPVASPSPTPAPGGSPGSGGGGGTTPQHNTFVFVSHAGAVSEFRTNSDGTLTLMSGSVVSFHVQGIQTAGNLLFANTDTKLLTYTIDPASGALTLAGSVDFPSHFGQMAADTRNVYVEGTDNQSHYIIFGFAVNANGTLTALSGFPIPFDFVCDICGSPFFMAMDSHFLLASMSKAGHGPGVTHLFVRNPDGSLQAPNNALSTTISMALHPNGQFEYDIAGDSEFEGNRIDANGQIHNIFFNFDKEYDGLALNPAGTFLLVVSSAGGGQEIQTYAVNQSTGEIAKTGSSASFIGDSDDMKFDPTGRFVLTRHGNDLFVYSFNSSDGSLKQIQNVAGTGVEQIWFATF